MNLNETDLKNYYDLQEKIKSNEKLKEKLAIQRKLIIEKAKKKELEIEPDLRSKSKFSEAYQNEYAFQMLLVPRNPMVQGEEQIVFPPKSSMGLSFSKKAVSRL